MGKANDIVRQLATVAGLIAVAITVHLISIDWNTRSVGEPYLALGTDTVWQAPYSDDLIARYQRAYSRPLQPGPELGVLMVPARWPATWDAFNQSVEPYRSEATYGPYSRFGSRLAGAVFGLALPALLILGAFYRLSGVALGRRRPRARTQELQPAVLMSPPLAA